MPVKIDSFTIEWEINHSVEYYDFISIDARIGDQQISNSDEISVSDAVEYSVDGMLEDILNQNAEDIDLVRDLYGLQAKLCFQILYFLNFGVQEEITFSYHIKNPRSFLCIPNGPEPFNNCVAFLISSIESDLCRILLKFGFSDEIIEVYSIKSEYLNEWIKLKGDLENLRIKRHRRNYLSMLDSVGESIFIERKKRYINKIVYPGKVVDQLFDFYVSNGLVRNFFHSDKSKLDGILKFREINELGWSLLEAKVDDWLKTKSTKSGNPNFFKLVEALNRQKKLLNL